MSVLSELNVGESVCWHARSPRGRAEPPYLMGFVPDALVTVLRRAPAGDPTVYGVDGMEIALRHETASSIQMRPSEPVADEVAQPDALVERLPMILAARLPFLRRRCTPRLIPCVPSSSSGRPIPVNPPFSIALTGLRPKSSHYPGIVEQRMGLMAGVRPRRPHPDRSARHLLAQSLSEDARVSIDVLKGQMPARPRPTLSFWSQIPCISPVS